ncbi:MAG: GNAT family N-acetyltransferase [Caulobacteraceae bacterium]
MTDAGLAIQDDITTPRLVLRRITLQAIEAGLAGDLERAGRLLGAALPRELIQEPDVLALGQARLEADPDYAPFGPRAIILRETREMIGHIGFHTAPDPDYLRPYARDAVELGYTVFGDHRRRGYASEALGGLIGWAQAAHGVRRFVASVSPRNDASLALVARHGFGRIGEHHDDIDGLEHIFLLDRAAPAG